MRLAVAAVLLPLAAMLAGCAGQDPLPEPTIRVSPAEATPGPPGPDTYWVVQVAGPVTRDFVTGPSTRGKAICDYAFDHAIDVERRTVRYEGHTYPYDPAKVWGMAVVDVRDQWGGCDSAYRLDANGRITPLRLLGRDDSMWVSINQNNGDVSVGLLGKGGAATVEPGMQARVRWEGSMTEDDGARYDVHGDVTVVNHGSWPRSGLQPNQ